MTVIKKVENGLQHLCGIGWRAGRLICVFFACVCIPRMLHGAGKPMNLIFILADDLGWSDTTILGQTDFYETPNIQRLADRGTVFSRAYTASPLCSPTRSSILTGRGVGRTQVVGAAGHAGHVALEAVVRNGSAPQDKMTGLESATRLRTDWPTLGKVLKDAGYATGHFGKWHLGTPPYSPLEQGFDVDVPHTSAPGPGPFGGFIAPWAIDALTDGKPGDSLQERMAREAIDWMNSLPEDQPFYMNYWSFSVHVPLEAEPDLVEKYREKIKDGDRRHSAVYAAVIEEFDRSIGMLLDALEQRGIEDNTAIIFFSDNGGLQEQTSNYPLRAGKATLHEGGVRVPAVVYWPGVSRAGDQSDVIVHSTDFYPTILARLGIPMPDGYSVDGVDISDALRGRQMNRPPVFSYFPIFVDVENWLPPSMSVYLGDWKLLRIFHNGENGAHEYRLFNLKDDIGETENLAAQYPEKVGMMDKLIQDYIDKNSIPVPKPNPRFNPARYFPENIGKKRADQTGIDVDGWVPAQAYGIDRKDGLLSGFSFGPGWVFVQNLERCLGGPFTVSFKMKQPFGGKGLLFYNHFSPATRLTYPRVPGEWQEVAVSIPVKELFGLRLDPVGDVESEFEIDWVKIENASGETVRQWDF